jgi:hypothetical protein
MEEFNVNNKKEKSKEVKSVAFSHSDPMEQRLLEYALKQRYFSTYVKRLIQRDMEQGHKVVYDDTASKGKIEKLERENLELKNKIEQIKELLN